MVLARLDVRLRLPFPFHQYAILYPLPKTALCYDINFTA